MKTYILKSWVDGKVVYKSDNLFSSENEMWIDVAVMKRQFFGTYAEVVRSQLCRKCTKYFQMVVLQNSWTTYGIHGLKSMVIHFQEQAIGQKLSYLKVCIPL